MAQVVQDPAAVALMNAKDRPHESLHDAEVVDKLGRTMAEAAPLLREIEDLKSELKLRGNKRYLGQFYEALVYASTHTSWISEKLERFLHPNQLRVARRHTPTQVCDVTARGLKR